MQAKILAQNEQTRELLRLALKGVLDGKITPEDCARLGMTEAEIKDLVRKFKDSQTDDSKSYKDLEEAVKTMYSAKHDLETSRLTAELNQLKSERMTMTKMPSYNSKDGGWDQTAKLAATGKLGIEELKRIVQEFAQQLTEKQTALNMNAAQKAQMQNDFKNQV
jgi:hypothetical protein